jgi:hypothetical protein
MAKKIAKTKTRAWDAAEHLKTEDDTAAYLEAAFEDGDPALIAAASTKSQNRRESRLRSSLIRGWVRRSQPPNGHDRSVKSA